MNEIGNATTRCYTCPAHADVRQSSPGKCAKCGLILVPEVSEPPSNSVWGPLAIVGLLATVATGVMLFMR
jgi:hypothetical protein